MGVREVKPLFESNVDHVGTRYRNLSFTIAKLLLFPQNEVERKPPLPILFFIFPTFYGLSIGLELKS